jgi:hypothetical protein
LPEVEVKDSAVVCLKVVGEAVENDEDGVAQFEILREGLEEPALPLSTGVPGVVGRDRPLE